MTNKEYNQSARRIAFLSSSWFNWIKGNSKTRERKTNGILTEIAQDPYLRPGAWTESVARATRSTVCSNYLILALLVIGVVLFLSIVVVPFAMNTAIPSAIAWVKARSATPTPPIMVETSSPGEVATQPPSVTYPPASTEPPTVEITQPPTAPVETPSLSITPTPWWPPCLCLEHDRKIFNDSFIEIATFPKNICIHMKTTSATTQVVNDIPYVEVEVWGWIRSSIIVNDTISNPANEYFYFGDAGDTSLSAKFENGALGMTITNTQITNSDYTLIILKGRLDNRVIVTPTP